MPHTLRILCLVMAAACLLPLPGHAAQHAPHGRTMTEYRFPDRIGWQRLPRDQEAAVPKGQTDPAAALEFALAGVDVSPERITATLVVTNPAESPVELPVSPCGGEPFPYGGSSPFLLRIDYSDQATQEAIRYTGILYPPAPPPPMKMTLPASSRTRFEASIDLKSHDYRGEPQVRLRWSFCRYGAPGTTGTLAATLPPRGRPE